MDGLKHIERELTRWHKAKYGTECVKLPATIRKLGEEIGELNEAVILGKPAHVAEEAADVLFVLSHIVRGMAGKGKFSAAVKRKLAVIWKRLEDA